MNLLQQTFSFIAKARAFLPRAWLPNEPAAGASERGARTTPENEMKYLYRVMWVDPDLRQAILDIREMDRLDGRVKRIHNRVARDVVKGGLIMQQATENKELAAMWKDFGRRLQLNRPEKLKSDARGLVMEGNLPIQWVLDKDFHVVAGVRMASETILPNVDGNGQFKDVRKAYSQFDIQTGRERAVFPLWQLFLCRFDPDSFDDMGALGRPFLDSSRTTWQKLIMTEEDLVIRRRVRAPLRLAHVLEGGTPEQLEAYRTSVEKDQHEITTDYYLNKKGGVTPVQGDSNLDQIDDVVYLLDSFFSGSPLPKGMMGYTDKLARDILEDLKRDYYDEIDGLQDTLAFAYEQGFRLELLLRGINPDDEDFAIVFSERRTETPSQAADRGLKLTALGLPKGMVFEELGYDPAYVRQRQEWEAKNWDPYPAVEEGADPAGQAAAPKKKVQKVSITPGNARKGESGTSIGNG
jgi:hypothetical protein